MKMYKWTTWTNGSYGPGTTIVLAETEIIAQVSARDALEKYVRDRYNYYFDSDDEYDIEQANKMLEKIENDLEKPPTVYTINGDTILIQGSE